MVTLMANPDGWLSNSIAMQHGLWLRQVVAAQICQMLTKISIQLVFIVVGVGAVEAAPQLHGHIVVGVRQAFHAQQGGARQDVEIGRAHV